MLLNNSIKKPALLPEYQHLINPHKQLHPILKTKTLILAVRTVWRKSYVSEVFQTHLPNLFQVHYSEAHLQIKFYICHSGLAGVAKIKLIQVLNHLIYRPTTGPSNAPPRHKVHNKKGCDVHIKNLTNSTKAEDVQRQFQVWNSWVLRRLELMCSDCYRWIHWRYYKLERRNKISDIAAWKLSKYIVFSGPYFHYWYSHIKVHSFSMDKTNS